MSCGRSSYLVAKDMNKKQRDHIEQNLLGERMRVVKEIAQYDESFSNTCQGTDGVLAAYSFHMADQGTDAMEREKAFLFASKEGRFLYHLEEALRRLYRSPKDFGKCEECKSAIGFERLDALPHTRLCIKCKEEEETGAAG